MVAQTEVGRGVTASSRVEDDTQIIDLEPAVGNVLRMRC